MKNVRHTLTGALTAVLSAALLCLAVLGTGINAKAAQLATPLEGVDISSYNGNIDFATLRASGISFVMVRVGNTKYGIDSKAVENINAANAAGLRVGAYCYTYAKSAAEAAADAELTLSVINGLPVSFPVAIDIEDKSQQNLPTETQQAIVNTFCAIIQNAGYTPIVYTNKNWFEQKLGAVSWDAWVAQYNPTCTYSGAYTMWQNGIASSLPGAPGQIDHDYVFSDYFNQIVENGTSSVDGATYVNWRKTSGTGFDGTNVTKLSWEQDLLNSIGATTTTTPATTTTTTTTTTSNAEQKKKQLKEAKDDLANKQAYRDACQLQLTLYQQQYDAYYGLFEQLAATPNCDPATLQTAADSVHMKQQEIVDATNNLQTAQADVDAAQAKVDSLSK
ncbi:MAG: GH25 family lysozyme [Lachnospiraceae bacterium]